MMLALSDEVLHSDERVRAIVEMLVKCNSTTYAQEMTAAHNRLLQDKRGEKESYSIYLIDSKQPRRNWKR